VNIKFLKLLFPRNGKVTKALFEVGDLDIKVGVTDIFRSIYNIGPKKEVELFLKQFGELVIKKMLAENNLSNYIFKTYNFTKTNGQKMNLGDIEERLKIDIIKAEEKQRDVCL